MQATRFERAASAVANGLYVLACERFCLGGASKEEIIRAEMDVLMDLFIRMDDMIPANVKLPPKR